MKHIVENVEELYRAREPTGELIIDEVVKVLRHFKMIYPEDVALILDVDVKDLAIADRTQAHRCDYSMATVSGSGIDPEGFD
jgi:uncharacterized protein YacL